MSTETPEQYSYSLRHDRFQAVLVAILLFGLYTSIVLSTLHELAIKKGLRSLLRPLIFLMLVMYACTTMYIVLVWKLSRRAFVDNATSTHSTVETFSQTPDVIFVLGNLARGSVMFIGDAIMIWRLWGLYGQSWAVIALPLLLAFGELAVMVARIVVNIRLMGNGISVEGPVFTGYLKIAHLSLTLAATVITTALIVYRIVRMGGFKRYAYIIGIVVESAALYSCALIIYMPFPFDPILWDTIPFSVLVIIPGIASTLIISRVTLDRGVEHTFHDKATYPDGPPAREASIRFHHSTLRTETATGTGTAGVWTHNQGLTENHDVENGHHLQEHSKTRATI